MSTGTILTLAYLPEQVSYFNVAPVVGGDDSVSFDGDIFQLSVYTIHRQGLPINREQMKIGHFLQKLNIRKKAHYTSNWTYLILAQRGKDDISFVGHGE